VKLILGSASPRRKQILHDMGYEFEVIAPDIDEKAIRDDDPERLVLALANAKADAVLEKIGNDPAIIITSDQVVSFENKILEKPESLDDARAVLKSFGSNPVHTVTSVVVTDSKSGRRYSGVDITTIYFKPFPGEGIETILKNQAVDILNRAGSFAIEHPLFMPFVKSREGEMESIMGLPKALTKKLIQKATQ
jgi:septum formation protein